MSASFVWISLCTRQLAGERKAIARAFRYVYVCHMHAYAVHRGGVQLHARAKFVPRTTHSSSARTNGSSDNRMSGSVFGAYIRVFGVRVRAFARRVYVCVVCLCLRRNCVSV